MSNDLIKFLQSVSDDMIAGKIPPKPDELTDQVPYAIAAGDNKIGLDHCATCGKPPTETGVRNMPLAFLFTDILSAREHRISAMCQKCQDETFKEPVEEDSGSDPEMDDEIPF